MSRVKLTEHKSKQLLHQLLATSYHGISATIDTKGKISFSTPLSKLPKGKKYVVKVDQGVKGRMKKGLVLLSASREEIPAAIIKIAKKGYLRFLIEEMVPHEQSQERYFSMERVREGILVRYAQVGGIDIETMKSKVKSTVINSKQVQKTDNQNIQSIAKALGVSVKFIQAAIHYFETYYVSFLEINPLVVECRKVESHILDLAVETDSTARFFIHNGWHEQDIVEDQQKSPEEIAIKKLSNNSQAALSFTLLNQNGKVWVLLSGGGASITLADEFYNLGYGKELGNYGEYSGNPNAQETYLYTQEVLKAMFKSKAKKKILLIGGGVANFTDVRITFQGILQSFEKYVQELQKQQVKIYVRRGGPMQTEGLAMMKRWLEEHDLYGFVAGPELPLHKIVRTVVKVL